MRLLLLSNSRDSKGRFLEYPRTAIREMLGDDSRTLAFIPFAAVRATWDDYEALATQAFAGMGYTLRSIHRELDQVAAISSAGAIVIGGGNTFQLLYHMQTRELLEPVRRAVHGGVPYIGWSAGSVVACPTIMTTNDMPIVSPRSFEALGLVPFQINAHYTDEHPKGFQGETRAERLAEYIAVNRTRKVVGLAEGTMLSRNGSRLTLIGKPAARLFMYSHEPRELEPDVPLDELLVEY